MRGRTTLIKIYKSARTVFGGHGIAGLPVLRTIHGFALKHLKSNFATVRGHKIFLDPKDSLNLSINGTYEEYETELMEKIVKTGDIVLDIGANIGYYTLLFAKLVGKEGKVFAFEPDPANFALLKKNIEANSYANVVLVNKGVADRTEKCKLYLSEDPGDHQMYDAHDGRKYIEVECTSIDDYFKNNRQKIDFIKMDIQGAEFVAAQGMLRVLNNNPAVKVISEFWPAGLTKAGAPPRAYPELFLANGFSLYEINESQKKLVPVNAISLLETYTAKKGNHTNILWERE